MDRRGYELDTIPPYDVLDVVRISPEGVEGAGRVGRYIGVITEEGAAEMVAGVNGVRAHGVRRARCQDVDVVVDARVMDVCAQIRAVDGTFGWWKTCEVTVTRRNEVAGIAA